MLSDDLLLLIFSACSVAPQGLSLASIQIINCSSHPAVAACAWLYVVLLELTVFPCAPFERGGWFGPTFHHTPLSKWVSSLQLILQPCPKHQQELSLCLRCGHASNPQEPLKLSFPSCPSQLQALQLWRGMSSLSTSWPLLWWALTKL